LAGPWSKLRGYCARLALIVHYLRWAAGEVSSENVDEESVNRAARLVAYFKSHARKVYAALDADPRTADARKLVRWIAANRLRRCTKRDAHQGLRGTFKTVEDLEAILAVLQKHGLIRPEAPPDRPGAGRKPSPAYETHPQLHATGSHNAQNTQNWGDE